MSHWFIYLITRLDTLSSMAEFFSIFGIIFFMILSIVYFILKVGEDFDTKNEVFKIFNKTLKILIIVLTISLPLFILTPTTKEAAVIYLLPKIVNNEKIQKVPNNFLDLLNSKTEEWLEDITKKKENK